MTRELNQAQARDWKAEHESESTADHLRKHLSEKILMIWIRSQAPETYSPAERSIF
jgi:hypothetical protein